MKINRVVSYLFFVVVVFLLLIVFKPVSTLPGVKNAIALATTVKYEAFTQLYFEDHPSLPKTIRPGETYSFSFTIHNLELKTTDYTYLVYIKIGEQKIYLDQGKVTLNSNEYTTIEEKFGPLKNLRSMIVVELLDKNQTIDFWMEN